MKVCDKVRVISGIKNVSDYFVVRKTKESREQEDLLDDAVAQTGDDHQHPGQSPLHGREHLSEHHRPLDCRRTTCSQTVTPIRPGKSPLASSHTWQAVVSDALGLCVVNSFLQHAQENDSSDPELDPEQISPVARRQDQPEHSQQHVHDTHHHVELEAEWKRRTVDITCGRKENYILRRSLKRALDMSFSMFKLLVFELWTTLI